MSEPDPSTSPLFDPSHDVVTEASALQALAHPLRLRLLGLLRAYGPSTATRLAARCGESSGLTSYHLRQLAGAGVVTDATAEDLAAAGEREAAGRERWWKAAQRSTYTTTPPEDDLAATAAHEDYLHAVLDGYSDNAHRWLSVSHAWPQPWREVGTFSDVPLRLTLAEARSLEAAVEALLARYRQHDPAQRPGSTGVPADSVIVRAQWQIFPRPDQDPPA